MRTNKDEVQKKYTVDYTVTFDGSMEVEASSPEGAEIIVNDQPVIDLYNQADNFDLTCDNVESVEDAEEDVNPLAEVLAGIATHFEYISAIKAIRDLAKWDLLTAKKFMDGCKAGNDPVGEFVAAERSKLV